MSDRITAKEKAFYPLGILGQNLMYNLMVMYMLFFFTDLLAIPAASASIILVIAGLWDAINDPMMGMIADHTRSRWGKFRPYLIFASFPAGILTVLCYSKFNLPLPVLTILMAVIYIMWGMVFTATDIPIWALSSVSSHEQGERNKMITLGKMGATFGTVIVTVCSVPLLLLFGGERVASSYTKLAAIYGGAGVVLMTLLGLTSKERIEPKKEKISLKTNLSFVFKNKPLLLLLISLFALNFSNSIRQSVQIYFALYTWGSASWATALGGALVIGMSLGMAITPKLMSKLKKEMIYITSSLLALVCSVIPFLDYLNIPLGLASVGLNFFFVGVAMVASTSMLIDTIDYGERKTNVRCEGIVFSMNTFVTKLGGTASKLILGAILVALDYVENAEVTPRLQRGFAFAVFIIPALAFIITVIPVFFYKVKEEK